MSMMTEICLVRATMKMNVLTVYTTYRTNDISTTSKTLTSHNTSMTKPSLKVSIMINVMLTSRSRRQKEGS